MNIMNIMAAPEMTRTNSAHAGDAKISKMIPGKNPEVQSSQRSLGKFESYLIESVEKMNSHQLDLGRVQEQLVTNPDSVDIHDVTTAMAKAQMSLSLAQTVIDRLLTGWSEIQTTR